MYSVDDYPITVEVERMLNTWAAISERNWLPHSDLRTLMILPIVQISALLSLSIYLFRWRAGLHRRNRQTWDSILARLQTDWSARELSDHFLWAEKLNSTPEETWVCIKGPKGLWAMYRNARVMMEMADYAALNSRTVDPLVIDTLRIDAIHIRLFALMALAQYPFSAAGQRVRLNAFRAASMYTLMAARMMQLLQVSAPGIVPDFVAAM
jgi:hypothetical protein